MPTDEAYQELLRRLDEHDVRLNELETRRAPMANEVEEVSAEFAGQKLNLKSLSLNTLLTLVGVVGVVGLCTLMWTHLGESKESSTAMVGAIRELTSAQKDQTQVMREGNCLNTYLGPPDQKAGFCKQVTR